MSEIYGNRSVSTLIREWRPAPFWSEHIGHAYELIRNGPSDPDRIRGWQMLTTMLGDSHAPEMCLLSALFAQTLEGPGAARSRFGGNIHLCLLELNLAHATGLGADGCIPVQELGDPTKFLVRNEEFARWLTAQLEQFRGDLSLAAMFALRLAAIRTNVLTGPSDFDAQEVLDERLWKLTR